MIERQRTEHPADPLPLAGKTALVTGGSRGIGRELALALAGIGADLVLNYAGNDAMAEETRRAVAELGRRCLTAKVDLSDSDCAVRMAALAEQVDILVLNASLQIRRPWQQITAEEMERQISCNFRANLLLIQQYAPAMTERRWGRIITVGSVQEARPHPDMLVYSSTKAALTHMARSLAVQLAPYGVTVNSIAPGVILTDRNTVALQDEAYQQAVLARIPLGDFGQPSDFAGLIRLLCTEEGRYITGQNLFVDGGMSIG